MDQHLSDEHNLQEALKKDEESAFLGFNVVPKDELEQKLKSIKEGEKEFKVTKRLETLDEAEIVELKDAVLDSKGVIRIFMHPSHVSLEEGQSSVEFDMAAYPPFKMLMDTVSNEKSPPIIILEDERSLEGNRLVLEVMDRVYDTYNKHVYIMPTIKRNGFVKLPDLDAPEMSIDQEFADMEDVIRYGQIGMHRLSDFFGSIGVKRMVVAGSSLRVNDEGLHNCVGSFIKYFELVNKALAEKKKDTEPISIQVSTATAPQGRTELREQGLNQFL